MASENTTDRAGLELAVVGTLLQHPETLAQAGVLDSAELVEAPARKIVSALRGLHAAGEPINAHIVAAEVESADPDAPSLWPFITRALVAARPRHELPHLLVGWRRLAAAEATR